MCTDGNQASQPDSDQRYDCTVDAVLTTHGDGEVHVKNGHVSTIVTPERLAIPEVAKAVFDALAAMNADLLKWRRIRTPGHGECCTCQACGLDHDECRCDLDDVADDLEQAKRVISDAHALIFNITEPRSEGDMLPSLDEQIELLRERHQAALAECPLFHTVCSTCGNEIRQDETCGCEGNRQPPGIFQQQTVLGHRADRINLLEAGLSAVHQRIHAIEKEMDELAPAPPTPVATRGAG